MPHPGLPALDDRDRALVRMLAAIVLRRLGTLRHLLSDYLEQGFPPDAPRVETALLIGAAQILWLDVPDHAAVDLSVRLAQADRRASRFPGLINAVLRQVARDGREAAAADRRGRARRSQLVDDSLERPLRRTDCTCDRRAHSCIRRRSISTVKRDPTEWAARLRGRVLPTGTVRTWRTARCHGCQATPKAPGGYRTPPRHCRLACSAT